MALEGKHGGAAVSLICAISSSILNVASLVTHAPGMVKCVYSTF